MASVSLVGEKGEEEKMQEKDERPAVLKLG